MNYKSALFFNVDYSKKMDCYKSWLIIPFPVLVMLYDMLKMIDLNEICHGLLEEFLKCLS